MARTIKSTVAIRSIEGRPSDKYWGLPRDKYLAQVELLHSHGIYPYDVRNFA